MNYKCLIAEDNEIERDALEMHLRKIKGLEIVAICSNGLEATNIIARQAIDIVFSDIDMPELSGMGLLKSIKQPPVFVFISSYSEYAAESFNLDAIDFIVKPANFERLLKSANKAIEYLELKKLQKNNFNLSEIPAPIKDHFFLKETKGYTRLNYNDVIYIESMGDFSKIFTANHTHITLVNLKNLEQQMPPFFARVHKQYIINLKQIITISTSEIHLKHDHLVPLSHTNRSELMQKVADRTLMRYSK